MLINFTNHPYSIWNTPQREAARIYGEVKDISFPQIEPSATSEELRSLTEEYAAKIEELHPDAVLTAGEFTFAFMIIDKLLRDGVKVICSCSKRITTEVKNTDGTNEKKAVFLFEGFREYSHYERI